MLDAGVVDQDVHRAELRLAGPHHGLDLAGPAHVGTVVGHASAPAGGHRGHLGLRRFHIAKAVEHHMGTLFGQGQGHAQADAAGGAGDEGGFSGEHAEFS